VLKKKILANFQRIIELFTKKIVKKLLKIWFWDPGSGIRDPGSGIQKKPIPDPGSRIPDPGVKKHPIPDPGSRIRIRNTVFQCCGSRMFTPIPDPTFFHPGSTSKYLGKIPKKCF
jgi:hypothetical protein